jgi:hypothetical protein
VREDLFWGKVVGIKGTYYHPLNGQEIVFTERGWYRTYAGSKFVEYLLIDDSVKCSTDKSYLQIESILDFYRVYFLKSGNTGVYVFEYKQNEYSQEAILARFAWGSKAIQLNEEDMDREIARREYELRAQKKI